MSYKVTKEVKSESKVGLWLYAFDFFFLLIYIAITYMLRNSVHEKLRIFYYFFSLAFAIFFTLPSVFNKKRRNYQTIYFYFEKAKKDDKVYKPEFAPRKNNLKR